MVEDRLPATKHFNLLRIDHVGNEWAAWDVAVVPLAVNLLNKLSKIFEDKKEGNRSEKKRGLDVILCLIYTSF